MNFTKKLLTGLTLLASSYMPVKAEDVLQPYASGEKIPVVKEQNTEDTWTHLHDSDFLESTRGSLRGRVYTGDVKGETFRLYLGIPITKQDIANVEAEAGELSFDDGNPVKQTALNAGVGHYFNLTDCVLYVSGRLGVRSTERETVDDSATEAIFGFGAGSSKYRAKGKVTLEGGRGNYDGTLSSGDVDGDFSDWKVLADAKKGMGPIYVLVHADSGADRYNNLVAFREQNIRGGVGCEVLLPYGHLDLQAIFGTTTEETTSLRNSSESDQRFPYRKVGAAYENPNMRASISSLQDEGSNSVIAEFKLKFGGSRYKRGR